MSQHPLVRIPGGCPAEDRRVSVGLQREPSSPSSQGSEPSGIRSGSDGNRRGLTLIVDQKTRTPHGPENQDPSAVDEHPGSKLCRNPRVLRLMVLVGGYGRLSGIIEAKLGQKITKGSTT